MGKSGETDQGRVGRTVDAVAAGSNRRGFLSKVSKAMAAVTTAGAVSRLVQPGEADGYHFCGHIYTTDSCPHPLGDALPRIDRAGFPLRGSDGHPIDNLGRPVNKRGEPVGKDGKPLVDADGRNLPPAPRTKLCEDITFRAYDIAQPQIDGGWYRCCGGQVRKLVDCCSTNKKRINGDEALQGYCFKNRKVFCVMYYDTNVPC